MVWKGGTQRLMQEYHLPADKLVQTIPEIVKAELIIFCFPSFKIVQIGWGVP